MVTNKIILRVVKQSLLIFTLVALYACGNNTITHNYYRYSIGRMHIKNPVLVVLKDSVNDWYVEYSWYVCSDSIARKCFEEGWRNREDVYPYVTYTSDIHRPTHYISPYSYLREAWDDNYHSFIIYSIEENDSIQVEFGKFFYYIEEFDAYMQAINGFLYDPNPEEHPEEISLDQFTYSADAYRIAVRQHYSLWQIFKLRYKEWLLTMEFDEYGGGRYGT